MPTSPPPAGHRSTLDLLTADQDGLDLAGWFDEQRKGGVTVAVDWAALETGKAGGFTLAIPIVPPRCGRRHLSPERRLPRGRPRHLRQDLRGAAPELFFKATARRSADRAAVRPPQGPAFTAAEPEVRHRVARRHHPQPLANDVSAWDIDATTRSTAAVEGLRRLLLVRADDRHAGRSGGSVRHRVTMLVSRGTTEVFEAAPARAS
jgi:hypothetical protein